MEDKPETQADVEKRLKYLADTKRFEDTTRNNAPRTTKCGSSFFAFGDFQRRARRQAQQRRKSSEKSGIRIAQ